MLSSRDIQISMTESGDPRENPVAERINGILKVEWIYDLKPGCWQETVAFVGKIIDLYNNQRPHQSIGYMVPALVHQTGMQTECKWKIIIGTVKCPSKVYEDCSREMERRRSRSGISLL